jgi:hypothetical protein
MRAWKVVLILTFLASSWTFNRSFADGQEVNNIWWNLVLNYNNSGEDVCIVENFNSAQLTAVFDVFPGDPTFPNYPVHATVTPTLAPYQIYPIFGWIRGITTIPETCTLKSWSQPRRSKHVLQ